MDTINIHTYIHTQEHIVYILNILSVMDHRENKYNFFKHYGERPCSCNTSEPVNLALFLCRVTIDSLLKNPAE